MCIPRQMWGPLPNAQALARALGGGRGRHADLAERLAATLTEHQALAVAERRALDRLLGGIDAPHVVIPRLETDVHDLAGLARLCERL